MAGQLDRAIARLMELDQESVLALADIAEERVRQIEGEDWSPEHDDSHDDGDLAAAGASYALVAHTPSGLHPTPPDTWPWRSEWWKPKSKHRNEVRAAALILAELARRYRRATAAVRESN